jgi:hypothetical protein
VTRGKEYYKNKIVEDSPVEVFTATNTAMIEYPYILGHPDEKSPTLSKQSEAYIMDSGIGDKEKNNDEVFEKAVDVDADYVVPKDVLGDTKATTEAVVDMESKVIDTDISMIVPTQQDDRLTRNEHYNELQSELQAPITDYRVAVGGIKDDPVHIQIAKVMELRIHVGSEQELHAFGCGITHDWVVTIRKHPELIDSLDTSRVQREVGNGKTIDGMMNVSKHPMPRGANSTCISAMHRERVLYMFNHIIGPHPRTTDVPTQFNHSGLGHLSEQYTNRFK